MRNHNHLYLTAVVNLACLAPTSAPDCPEGKKKNIPKRAETKSKGPKLQLWQSADSERAERAEQSTEDQADLQRRL